MTCTECKAVGPRDPAASKICLVSPAVRTSDGSFGLKQYLVVRKELTEQALRRTISRRRSVNVTVL